MIMIAKKENMEFNFSLLGVNKERDEIMISMYSAEYTLVKKGDIWQNSSKNKMDMSPSLIAAVVKAVFEE